MFYSVPADQLRYKQYYTKDCTTMVLLIVVAVVVLLEIAAWALALVWKLKLMKGEKQLLANGGVSQGRSVKAGKKNYQI